MDQKVITKSPRPNNWALKSYRKGVNDDYRGQRLENEIWMISVVCSSYHMNFSFPRLAI